MTPEQTKAETIFNSICTSIWIGVWVLLSGILDFPWWVGLGAGLIGSTLFVGCFRDGQKQQTTFMGQTFRGR